MVITREVARGCREGRLGLFAPLAGTGTYQGGTCRGFQWQPAATAARSRPKRVRYPGTEIVFSGKQSDRKVPIRSAMETIGSNPAGGGTAPGGFAGRRGEMAAPELPMATLAPVGRI